MVAQSARGRVRSTGGGIGLPDAITQPWFLPVAPVAVFAILFLLGRSNEAVLIVHIIVFSIFGLVIYVWCLVAGFQKSVLDEVLLLLIPIYGLFFVFFRNESAHLKGAYGAAVLGNLSFRLAIISFMATAAPEAAP
jgi:hypothetical protein